MTLSFDHNSIDEARFNYMLPDLIESGYRLDEPTVETERP